MEFVEENKRDFKGVWIPKEIWLNNEMSILEKAILVEIDSLDNEETGCYASNKYLSEFCQCSETKISKAISKLIDMGYLYIKSFDGRTRIIKSRLIKSAKKTFKKYKTDLQKVQTNNIINNIRKNNIVYNKKERKTSDYDTIINELILDDNLKNTVYEFIKMRKLIKKPMTDFALKKLLNKLLKMSTDVGTQIKILEQSITACWQDIYPLRDNKPKQKQDDDDWLQRMEEANREIMEMDLK